MLCQQCGDFASQTCDDHGSIWSNGHDLCTYCTFPCSRCNKPHACPIGANSTDKLCSACCKPEEIANPQPHVVREATSEVCQLIGCTTEVERGEHMDVCKNCDQRFCQDNDHECFSKHQVEQCVSEQ